MPPQQIQYYLVTLPQGCDVNYNTQRIRSNCKCEIKNYDFEKVLVKVVSGSIYQLNNDGFVVEPVHGYTQQMFNDFTLFQPNIQANNRPYHQDILNINFQNAIPPTQFSQPYYDKHRFQHPNIPQPPLLPAANHFIHQPPQKVITLQLDVASFGAAFAMELDDYLAQEFTTCKTQIYNNNILITDTKDMTDQIKAYIAILYGQKFKVYESEV
ncbi:Hypothetical_protein [Hexamita inflata]|uniref:Hypothetical_protein n=1 Tax=Hexamita inflata TaxID=28002 RepID=A0AA86RFM9_9EUKA|nr:Hypothetical protein HINF_LOCUS2818 [Hexamita inflata]CAI9915176.1 Hypothetical protein HINF_LOCUS2821 [Hexamita inflata]CAI9977116.1 Hypothetical protein HINF_LOCUS64761 [Hexamita inflata]CAI9977119.1 Hypothetical protein HINF_LOCUS64764 [Hexamita inflata]